MYVCKFFAIFFSLFLILFIYFDFLLQHLFSCLFVCLLFFYFILFFCFFSHSVAISFFFLFVFVSFTIFILFFLYSIYDLVLLAADAVVVVVFYLLSTYQFINKCMHVGCVCVLLLFECVLVLYAKRAKKKWNLHIPQCKCVFTPNCIPLDSIVKLYP